MTVRISLFWSPRGWWKQPDAFDSAITDIVDRTFDFKAGRATLLTEDGRMVTGLARGSRRGSASHFEHNVTFDRIHAIDAVPIEALVDAIRPPSRSAARRVFDAGYGLLSEAASSDIRASLSHPALEAIIATDPLWMADAPDAAAQYRMERDAVNIALEIAGFDRELALAHVPSPATAAHFLDRESTRSNEDEIVIDELDVFPGWDRFLALRPAGRVFEDRASARRLTVLHANKNAIEQSNGVDLVYFVNEYRSFVLLQYKRVRREGRDLLVRLDEQLDDECERMREVEKQFRGEAQPATDLLGYRLASAMCFFKLCETEQPAVVSDLARGKYVDLATWSLLEADGVTAGPRGGRRLFYNDVTRYMTNSLFAELVSEGWIGSATEQFDPLLDYLFEHYEEGRSLILASLRLGRTFRRAPTVNQRLSVRSMRPATAVEPSPVT